MKNKEELYSILVTSIEKRIIVKALVELKKTQENENKTTDFLDDILVKVCDAPNVREKKKKFYETR